MDPKIMIGILGVVILCVCICCCCCSLSGGGGGYYLYDKKAKAKAKVEEDKKIADKKAADKVAADKVAADKVAADKEAADKEETDRLKLEMENKNSIPEESPEEKTAREAREKEEADQEAKEKEEADKLAVDTKLFNDKKCTTGQYLDGDTCKDKTSCNMNTEFQVDGTLTSNHKCYPYCNDKHEYLNLSSNNPSCISHGCTVDEYLLPLDSVKSTEKKCKPITYCDAKKQQYIENYDSEMFKISTTNKFHQEDAKCSELLTCDDPFIVDKKPILEKNQFISNRVCKNSDCGTNQYYDNSNSVCKNYTRCKKGHGIKNEGTGTIDHICDNEPCPSGTWSDGTTRCKEFANKCPKGKVPDKKWLEKTGHETDFKIDTKCSICKNGFKDYEGLYDPNVINEKKPAECKLWTTKQAYADKNYNTNIEKSKNDDYYYMKKYGNDQMDHVYDTLNQCLLSEDKGMPLLSKTKPTDVLATGEYMDATNKSGGKNRECIKCTDYQNNIYGTKGSDNAFCEYGGSWVWKHQNVGGLKNLVLFRSDSPDRTFTFDWLFGTLIIWDMDTTLRVKMSPFGRATNVTQTLDNIIISDKYKRNKMPASHKSNFGDWRWFTRGTKGKENELYLCRDGAGTVSGNKKHKNKYFRFWSHGPGKDHNSKYADLWVSKCMVQSGWNCGPKGNYTLDPIDFGSSEWSEISFADYDFHPWKFTAAGDELTLSGYLKIIRFRISNGNDMPNSIAAGGCWIAQRHGSGCK